MAKLDIFLQKILFDENNILVMENDECPCVIIKDKKVKLTNQLFGMPVIKNLVAELLPPEQKCVLEQGGEISFTYGLSKDNVFDGTVLKSDTKIKVVLIPRMVKETKTAPVPKIAKKITSIYELLEQQIELKASDLHLSCGITPVVRLDGDIKYLDDFNVLDGETLEELLLPIIENRNLGEFKTRNDTDFSFEIPGKARFRVNVFRDRKGIAAAFRLIPYQLDTIEALGLPDVVKSLCLLDKGLILVTGPTGSGKSTTLAAMINYINENRRCHIITIEDPIEFVHENKNCILHQREVGSHTESFRKALRAALREDPDVILIGEMRDLETVSIALETAETGHLVLATLHTSTAPSTIDRIIDQFPHDQQPQIRVMLSETLRAVIAQALLKKKIGGRIAAFELLITNVAIANLIREGKTHQIVSSMQTSKQQGMMLLSDSLLRLVKEDIVEPREALSKAFDKVSFLSSLKTSAGIVLNIAL